MAVHNTRKDSGEFDIHYTSRPDGGATWEHANIQIVLLADIRRELRALNRLLNCSNFTGFPQTLRDIKRKIPTRKRRKKK